MSDRLNGHVVGPPRANRLAPELLAQLGAGAALTSPDGTYGASGNAVAVVTVTAGKIVSVAERPLPNGVGGGGTASYFPSGW